MSAPEFGGEPEVPSRHEERARLLKRVEAARMLWESRTWDHGAEIAYQSALEELVRFEEGR